MPIKKFKPVTPGSRYKIGTDYSVLTTDKPEKSLLAKLSKSGGRNHDGKMTNRHRGGGHKRRYRIIDFKRDKEGIKGVVKSLEYDPNRSSFICLIEYSDGEKRYIIAPVGLRVGDQILSGPEAEIRNQRIG